MTISYSYEVSNNKLFGLLRLLFRWRGSIWKVIFFDGIIYFFLYLVIRLVRELALHPSEQEWFDEFCLILKGNIEGIPIAFLLGFFVSQVYSRWQYVYNSIPWPFALVDALCLTIQVPDGETDKAKRDADKRDAKLIVQTASRYMHLCLAMTLRDICYQFRELLKEKKLTFVDIGLASEAEMRQLYSTSELMPHELEKLKWPKGEKNADKRTASWNWWVPCVWASRLVRSASDRGFVDSKENLEMVFQKIHTYKATVGGLVAFDCICVPLPYTQVVSMGVYLYFLLALFAYQHVESETAAEYDKYFVPSTLLLRFLIYYGWYKVAEVLLTPFGNDLDYNYDMIGYFALHLEQSRAHVEYSYDLGKFLREDKEEALLKLARVPREDLFVEKIDDTLFGSLMQGIIDIPQMVVDTSVALWMLPKNVWNNDLHMMRPKFKNNKLKSNTSSKSDLVAAAGGNPGQSNTAKIILSTNALAASSVQIETGSGDSGEHVKILQESL